MPFVEALSETGPIYSTLSNNLTKVFIHININKIKPKGLPNVICRGLNSEKSETDTISGTVLNILIKFCIRIDIDKL